MAQLGLLQKIFTPRAAEDADGVPGLLTSNDGDDSSDDEDDEDEDESAADNVHASEGGTTTESSNPPRVRSPVVEPVPAPTTNSAPPAPSRVPTITQDDDDDDSDDETPRARPRWMERYMDAAREREETPSQNTRSRRTISDEVMLSCLEVSSGVTARSAAGQTYPTALMNEWAAAVLDAKTGELLEYRHLLRSAAHKEIWGAAFGKEIGRLAQGLPGVVEGTDTVDFIDKDSVPADRWKDVTYARIVCNYRPEKSDPNRVRITVGGNKINYPEDCGTPTADLFTVKLLLNSVVSTPGAKFMTMDISNFYLMTPLKRKEYLRMRITDMPDNVIDQYKLRDKVTKDGWIFVAVKRGMYGLPQAGILAQELLEQRLNQHGYSQSKLTPGFWTHEWRPICFTLVVDDFGVKYEGKEHADHLISAVRENYDLTTDWEGTRYLGLTFDWDYDKREVHLSMPDYIPDALKRFKHERPTKRQDAPHPHVPITYGAKQQYAPMDTEQPQVSAEDKLFIQQVLGTFLYYARAVDSTMLVALSAIASEQSRPTKSTMNKVDQFLDYVASQDEAILTYRASDMILAVHSDASYLSEAKARSRAGGHFFMSSDTELPPNNGAVLTIAQIIKAVMSSAAEAEIGALFVNARQAVPARQTLEEMGHPQPRTPMQTDNSAAHQLVTNNVQPKRTKPMDMRFHWLRDRDSQGQFRFYWRPGTANLGDYHTKHHPGKHHQNVRPQFVSPRRVLDDLRRRQQVAKLAVKSAQGFAALSPPRLQNISANSQAAAAA